MSRSSRLSRLHRLREQQSQGLARELAHANDTFAQSRARLTELTQMLNTYTEASAVPGQHTSSGRLQDNTLFLKRLKTAVTSQESLVEQARQRTEIHRAAWLKHYRENNALDKLIDKTRRVERLDQDRRNQRLLDENRVAGHVLD